MLAKGSNISKLVLVFLSLCFVTRVSAADCYWEWDNGYREYNCDEYDFPTGWIIAIAIIALILFIGIPVLLCFCCAWACFSGRNKAKGQVHYPATVIQNQQGQGGMVNPGFQGMGVSGGSHPHPQQFYPQQNYAYPQQPPVYSQAPPNQDVSVEMPMPAENQPAGWKSP